MEPMNCTAWVKPDGVRDLDRQPGAGPEPDDGRAAHRPQARAGEDPFAAARRRVRPPVRTGRAGRSGAAVEAGERAGAGRVLARRRHARLLLPPDGAWRACAAASTRRQHRSPSTPPPCCDSLAEGSGFEALIIQDRIDGTAVEGLANLPYAIPNLKIDWVQFQAGRAHLVSGARSAARRMRSSASASSTSWRTPPARIRSSSAVPCSTSIRAIARRSSSRPRKPAGARRCRAGRARGIAVAESLRQPTSRSRRGVDRGRTSARASRGDRGRRRHGGQSQPGRRADGGRHGLRPVGRAVRPDHVAGRQGRAEQLPRLSGAADERDAGGRGAPRAVDRAAGRRRRARHAADRAGGGERAVRVDRASATGRCRWSCSSSRTARAVEFRHPAGYDGRRRRPARCRR